MPPDASAIGGRAVTVRWMGHEKKVVHAPEMGISVASILGQRCNPQRHSGEDEIKSEVREWGHQGEGLPLEMNAKAFLILVRRTWHTIPGEPVANSAVPHP